MGPELHSYKSPNFLIKKYFFKIFSWQNVIKI